MSWVAAAVASASATIGAYRYFRGKSQAKKNIRPEFKLDPQYQENIDILTNTMGLPQSALDLYYRSVGQNTNQGINAILGAGGNGNQISNLVGDRNQQFQQIAMMDAMQKKQDIMGIINARQMLANQKDTAWQLKEFNPYKDRAQALAFEEQAGFAQIGGALNSASAAFANNATSKLADSLGETNTNPTLPPTTPNSGVNTNQLFQQFQQLQPNLNFGQPNNQFNFQQPAPLPFSPQFQPQSQLNFGQPNQFNFPQQPQIPQPQAWNPRSLQAPPIPYADLYQNSSPYGNTGLDYRQFWNYIMGIQAPQ